jgi:hypothetical protein
MATAGIHNAPAQLDRTVDAFVCGFIVFAGKLRWNKAFKQ